MSDNFAPILEALGRLDAKITHVSATVDAGFRALNERVGKVEERLNKLDERVGKLDERVGKLDERVGKLEDRVGRLEDSLTRVRVDVMARLDRQQHALAEIKDDMAVNMGGVESVRNLNDQTRKDLSFLHETVSVLHRRLRKLEDRLDRQEGQ